MFTPDIIGKKKAKKSKKKKEQGTNMVATLDTVADFPKEIKNVLLEHVLAKNRSSLQNLPEMCLVRNWSRSASVDQIISTRKNLIKNSDTGRITFFFFKNDCFAILYISC